MARTLDMKSIMYVNLFEKVTRIKIQHCFLYNSIIIFVVPRELMSRAIGEDGKNVKRLSEILQKKVKIVPAPMGRGDIERFILAIVHPVKFKNIELRDDKIIINAGMQSKAALIGRNKARLNEMKNILEEYFGIKELRIA